MLYFPGVESIPSTSIPARCPQCQNDEVIKFGISSAGKQCYRCKNNRCDKNEMWSFVKKKSSQRWLWHAIDHHTHEVLAYHIGPRQEEAFRLPQEK